MFTRAGLDLEIRGQDGTRVLIRDYFQHDEVADLWTPGGAVLSGELVARLAGPVAEGWAQAAGSPARPIGVVEQVVGEVRAERADGASVILTEGSSVFQGDVVVTGPGARLGIRFADDTAFAMEGDGRMVLDELVYDAASGSGSASFSILQGAFVFVTGQIAQSDPDSFEVKTPLATIGVRGTVFGGVLGERLDVYFDDGFGFVVNQAGRQDIDQGQNLTVLAANQLPSLPVATPLGQFYQIFTLSIGILPTTPFTPPGRRGDSQDGDQPDQQEGTAPTDDATAAEATAQAPANTDFVEAAAEPESESVEDLVDIALNPLVLQPIPVDVGVISGPLPEEEEIFNTADPVVLDDAGTSDSFVGTAPLAAALEPVLEPVLVPEPLPEPLPPSGITFTGDGDLRGRETTGPDNISGGGGADTIAGGGGNDILNGGAGNDVIDGGTGIDTATFGGNLAAYSFSPGSIIVVGPDGRDTLIDVEFLSFDDQTIPAPTFVVPQQQPGIIDGPRVTENILTVLDASGVRVGSTVDHILFTVNTAGTVTIDTLSWEQDTQDSDGDGNTSETFDINGDGEIAFIDVYIYLFQDAGGGTPGTLIASNDDSSQTFNDGSIYSYDSYLSANLAAGDYVLALGAFSLSETEARAQSNDVTRYPVTVNSFGSQVPTDHGDYQVIIGGAVTINAVNQGSGGGTITGGTGTTGNDILTGTAAAELIDGLAGNDLLDGLGGNDTLLGGPGADTILGADGDDTISGGAGNDTIAGGGNNDVIDGGDGTADVAEFSGARVGYRATTVSGTTTVVDIDPLDGDDGTDTLTNIEILGFSDGLAATPPDGGVLGPVGFTGAAGDDTFTGTAANEVIDGLAGNDLLGGGDGDDTISGGTGNDTIAGGGNNDVIDGGAGTADVAAFSGARAGYTITTVGGTTTVVDTNPIDADDGTDTLTNIEFLQFSGGTVLVVGSATTVTGTAAAEILVGTAGDDTLIGGAGADTLDGRLGTDIVDYSSDPAGVNVNLATGTATDGFGATDTLISIEGVITGGFDDVITTGPGNDIVDAGASLSVNSSGNIFGGTFDRIVGSIGNDTIDVGGGLFDYDIIDYRNAGLSAPITVDLRDPTNPFADKGVNGRDSLINQSTFGGDGLQIKGTAFADTFFSSDTYFFTEYQPGGGVDTINGGAMIDRVDYRDTVSTTGITADLGAGFAIDGFGDRDVLISVEQIESGNQVKTTSCSARPRTTSSALAAVPTSSTAAPASTRCATRTPIRPCSSISRSPPTKSPATVSISAPAPASTTWSASRTCAAATSTTD